jgi:hypothetical protein
VNPGASPERSVIRMPSGWNPRRHFKSARTVHVLSRLVATLLQAAVLIAWAGTATGQTISPLVSEYREKARGRVTLQNDSDWPLDVVLRTRGFTLTDDGQLHDLPIAPEIKIDLSAMSLRIPAGQKRYVFYEATAQRRPAWFVLFAVFSGFPARDTGGVNVQVELPHVIYLLPKATISATDVVARLVEIRSEDHRAVVEVENIGPNFVRFLETEVQHASQKADSVPFPLLPGGRRRLEVVWNAAEEPDRIVLKGRGFVLTSRLVSPTR